MITPPRPNPAAHYYWNYRNVDLDAIQFQGEDNLRKVLQGVRRCISNYAPGGTLFTPASNILISAKSRLKTLIRNQ